MVEEGDGDVDVEKEAELSTWKTEDPPSQSDEVKMGGSTEIKFRFCTLKLSSSTLKKSRSTYTEIFRNCTPGIMPILEHGCNTFSPVAQMRIFA